MSAKSEGGMAMARSDVIRLTDEYQQVLAEAFRHLLGRIERQGQSVDRMARADLRREASAAVTAALDRSSIGVNAAERERLIDEVLDDVLGLGPLEQLLRDPTIDDIIVNGYSRIYVERSGVLMRAPVRFRDNAHVLTVIQRIVGSVGRRVDEASPYCDARLPDGTRVNVVIPPIALDGPSLSLRKARRMSLGPRDLVRRGFLPEEVLRYLAKAVEHRLNILIVGGAGAGKTTLLNAISAFIGGNERVVTIEDAAELRLQQEHVVRLETRPPGPDGRGAITARDLMRNALRMRPDRIIVGEVRGGEAVEMLQAMSTGHDGSLSTLHASGTRDALARLEMLLAISGLALEPRMMRRFIASSLHVLVEVRRMSDGQRKLVAIDEVMSVEEDVYRLQEVYRYSGERSYSAVTAPLAIRSVHMPNISML